MHKCKEKDFKKMNKPSRVNENRFKKLKSRLFCLDETDVNGSSYDYSFYGTDDFTPHRRIEYIFMPCLAYKNLTKSKESVTCKGSVEEWEQIKKETETLLARAELAMVYNT